jgi:hypothetical protein
MLETVRYHESRLKFGEKLHGALQGESDIWDYAADNKDDRFSKREAEKSTDYGM